MELFFWPDEDGERNMCAAGPDPSRMLKVHELTERLPSKLLVANGLQTQKYSMYCENFTWRSSNCSVC